jgi:glutaredoxin
MTFLCRMALLVALISGLVGAACKRSHASVAVDPPSPPVVKDDTEGYVLTWIDDKGDFHVESRVADVPMMGRDAVRVDDATGKPGGPVADRIFAADLRQTRPDGTYAVRTMARADFEAIAVARREKQGPTLASAPPSSATAGGPAPITTTKPSARALVIIYGAEWCGACHDAARYLRRKGIPYVEKDVEKDPSAAREMQQKLEKRGLHTGSIPVLDVRGKIVVGFNSAEVDAALGEPL